ncbi:dephospho-CoA kinase [Pistricoccus aurantiacus]|uniref:dephospho-CoA kinase n=1 Tax=Pistricoccus aurantiacus TaxID=1883414 RepID=UPI003635C19C
MSIGLTGGIASGKSSVARAFEALGIEWVDADDTAREVVAPGEPALADIVARHGKEILDEHGELNRRALRERIFADETERRWLEGVIHPRVRERLLEHMRRMAQGPAPYHLVVVPLLFEAGLSEIVDRRLVIDVPESLQIERTASRDGVSEAQARAIVDAQLPREERLARADDVIDNSGDLEALKRQVAELDEKYRRLAKE